MYCIKCGAELSAGQTKCPLCETKVYHPDFVVEEKETYPKNNTPPDKFDKKGLMFIFTAIFLIPFALCLICDLSVNHRVVWSGYAMGGILLAYVMTVLPNWFRRPNPVIFVPSCFGAILLYLFYIDLETQGDWFLTFALPTVGFIAVIVTAVVALNTYVRRGYLFIYGGASIALGALTVLIEVLISYTFYNMERGFIWSIYPLVLFFIIGMALIVIGCCPPLRNSLKKKFFL